MKKPVIRKVLTLESDLNPLRKRALVKSEYGNKKLYDTLDWRPLTKHDFLIEMIKHPLNDRGQSFHIRQWTSNYTFYREQYKKWAMVFFDDGTLRIAPMSGKGKWRTIGVATLTKTFT